MVFLQSMSVNQSDRQIYRVNAFTIDRVPEGGILHVRLSDKHQALETLTENLEGDSIYKFLLKGQFHLLVSEL